jgi:hypothetical protein
VSAISAALNVNAAFRASRRIQAIGCERMSLQVRLDQNADTSDAVSGRPALCSASRLASSCSSAALP